MPTFPTHAAAALAIGSVFPRTTLPFGYRVAGAVCAVLPDADVIGFAFGIEYGDFLGHRGFTHSLCFAALMALTVVLIPLGGGAGGARGSVWLYLFLATASHGVLDAFTNGGLGIALLAPFDTTRYFFPVRPIVVSPIGLAGLVSLRTVRVLASEALFVWLPAAAFAGIVTRLRRNRRTLVS